METMSEPSTIFAGDTLTWSKSLEDYPASAWTLTYSFVRQGKSISVTASAEGNAHRVSVAASTTATWLPGTYLWTSYATSGSERYTVETGELVIKPNPAAGGYDTRSYVKRVLDAIEALIEGRAAADVDSYSIGGRSLSKMPIAELLKWRSQYRREYQAEQSADRLARGLGSGRKILTRL